MGNHINPVDTPTTILKLEGYFHFENNMLLYRQSPAVFWDEVSGMKIDLIYDDHYAYRLIIEELHPANDVVELIFDKTAYWQIGNMGIMCSETPIRDGNGGYNAPQVKFKPYFESKNPYRLTWIQIAT